MARSRRKTPIFGRAGAPSEKADKRTAHHTERATARAAIETSTDLEGLLLSSRREAHSDARGFAKDGKKYSSVLVTQVGRALKVLRLPRWLKSDRDVHKVMGK